jgi:hypothetical protein
MPTPKVFTILNCGTAYDSSNKDVIAELNRSKLAGTPGIDWMLNPGPGTLAAAKRTDLAQVFTAVRASPLGAVPGVGIANAVDKGGEVAASAFFGWGMEAAVEKTIKKLKEIRPEKINMAAWSRGAIVSIRIANQLREDSIFNRCQINMFLFDPVPGPHRGNPLNWREVYTHIPNNVHDCSVVLMEDEGGRFMSPFLTPLVDPFGQQRPRGLPPFNVYQLPGLHYSAVEWTDHDDPRWTSSYQIGRHLCCAFLLNHGTQLARGWTDTWIIRNPVVLLDLYSQLKLSILDHGRPQSKRREWIGRAMRDCRQLVEPDKRYFINTHNAHVFRKVFPKTNPGSPIEPKDKTRMEMAHASHLLRLLHYYDHSAGDRNLSAFLSAA